jgi:dolichol kinase
VWFSDSEGSLDRRRKYFHGLFVLVVYPVYTYSEDLISLAFSVVLALFIFIEYFRREGIWPFNYCDVFFQKMVSEDERRCNRYWSHFSLLLGTAIPWWSGVGILGLLCLGIADSAASTLGKQFVRHRWPNSKKTFEGTVAFIVSLGVSMHLSGYDMTFRTFFAVVLTGVAEANIENDNIVIPCILCVLMRTMGLIQVGPRL